MWAKKVQTDKINTLVGRGTKIDGKIKSSSSVRIDGELLGEIRVDGNVILGKESKVKGDIHALNATIEGHIEGHIYVAESVHLVSTCDVHGDISAHSIEIEKGAKFNGRSTMLDKKGKHNATSAKESKTGEAMNN
jgi:cytoskeletal protein CcmA (bactofilin family)